MNKLVLALAVGIALCAGVYKFVHVDPQRAALAAATAPAPKAGSVYVLKDQVVVDLEGGGYATVTVGLEIPPDAGSAKDSPEDVRNVVLRDLNGVGAQDLLDRKRRNRLKARLARDIRAQTDIEVEHVLLTDFTIRR